MHFFPYNHEAARVVAARFIINEGGSLNYTKLMKLMYLLERKSLVINCAPVVGGRYVAMKNGPLISEAYDAVRADSWEGVKKEGYNVRWQGNNEDVENYLSDQESAMLDELSDFFRSYDYGKMIDYTHDDRNCPEWTTCYVQDTSSPIPLHAISGCDAEELEAYAHEMSIFASAKE